MAFETEKEAKSIAEERKRKEQKSSNELRIQNFDDIFSKIKEELKISMLLLNDLNGSLEAVKFTLERIEVEGVRVKVTA